MRLQASIQQTFRDLKMKYLRRRWLEIIAVKAYCTVAVSSAWAK